MSYDDKLRREYHRREAALLRMKLGAGLLSNAVSDKVTETREAITTRISQAQSAVTDTIAKARERIGEKLETLQQAVNPAQRIRQHPFAWIFGALVAGIATAPALRALIKRNGTKRTEVPQPEVSLPLDKGEIQRGSPAAAQATSYLLPVLDAFLPLAVQYLRQRLDLSGPAPQAQTPAGQPVPASISRRMRNMPRS
jgi:hypothetical protein